MRYQSGNPTVTAASIECRSAGVVVRSLVVSTFGLLAVILWSGCGAGTGGESAGGTNGVGTVGAAGGTVSMPGGPSIVVPPGALVPNTTISVAASARAVPAGAVSSPYQFGPEGTTFTAPVAVSFPVPAGTVAAEVAVYWTKAGSTIEWEVIPVTVNGTWATASVTHFSMGYVGSLPGYSYAISGKVSGVLATGVTLTLSGSRSATTTADSSGAYQFSGLPSGSYVVTPSLGGWAFIPASASVTVSGASVAAQDFTGATCGSAGGTCCPGNACGSGLTCGNGTCQPPTSTCGGASQACCSGAVCGGGLTCTNGSCMTVTLTSVVKSICPDGGTLSVGGATLVVPPLGVYACTDVSFAAGVSAVPVGYLAYSPVYTYEPVGLAATISVPSAGIPGQPTFFQSLTGSLTYSAIATTNAPGEFRAQVSQGGWFFLADRNTVCGGVTQVCCSGGTCNSGAACDAGRCSFPKPPSGTLVQTGPAKLNQYQNAGTLLRNGQVLITGIGVTEFSLNAELFDPLTRTFTAFPAPGLNRKLHFSFLLPNGKVLLGGGIDFDAPFSVIPTFEERWNQRTPTATVLFDPTTRTFSPTGSLPERRSDKVATQLSDGRVLLTGGWKVVGPFQGLAGNDTLVCEADDAYLYDPSTETWRRTGSMKIARRDHEATLMADGRVLITGGSGCSNGAACQTPHPEVACKEAAGLLSVAEIYDPATETFSTTGAMPGGRYGHTATLLKDGNVLLAAGCCGLSYETRPGGAQRANFGELTSALLFDPRMGTFADAGSLNLARTNHAAVRLQDGRVLLAGGTSGVASSPVDIGNQRMSAELYDPSSQAFQLIPWDMPFSVLTLLSDGLVLTYGMGPAPEIYSP
jgi:hypothetical protein